MNIRDLEITFTFTTSDGNNVEITLSEAASLVGGTTSEFIAALYELRVAGNAVTLRDIADRIKENRWAVIVEGGDKARQDEGMAEQKKEYVTKYAEEKFQT